MLTARYANDRGHVRMGWLDTWHTFSFGSYYDAHHMGSSVLRVINDDKVAAHAGFGMHGHRNMEILTVMLAGALTHKDSMNNEARLEAGEYQLMSAGRGVMHSEMNHGDTPVHLLQIWLEPNEMNTEPGYQQARLPDIDGMTLIASPQGEAGSFNIRQNTRVWRGKLPQQTALSITLDPSRTGWIQVINGALVIEGQNFNPGDGIEITQQTEFSLIASENTDLLYFDLP